MTKSALILIIILLVIICLCLLITLLLFRRQMDSICRQIEVHRKEDSNTDYWLDIVHGPFTKLQSELNKSEKQKREQKRKFKKQESAWQELVSNVSHDIRTPITSVSGYFQLLMETEDTEKKDRYAKIIANRLAVFQEMLEDFFSYSTAVSMDRKIEIDRIDATRVVTETLFLFYEEVEERFNNTIVELPDEAFCYGNAKDLTRVIQNIVKNALSHGKGFFKVSLEIGEKIEISFENETEEKLDNIDLSQVFERTYRLDESRHAIGTGLGLCIVKELVTQMGGEAIAYNRGEHIFGIRLMLRKG